MSTTHDTWISARPTTAHPRSAKSPVTIQPRRDERPPWVRITMAYVVVLSCFYELAVAIWRGRDEREDDC